MSKPHKPKPRSTRKPNQDKRLATRKGSEALLRQALHDRLTELLSVQPLSERTLLDIATTARDGAGLLSAWSLSGVDPHIHRRRFMYAGPGGLGETGLASQVDSMMGDSDAAPAPASETFGVRAIREILSVAQNMMAPRPAEAPTVPAPSGPKLDELVRALAIARETGQVTLVAQLQELFQQQTGGLLLTGLAVPTLRGLAPQPGASDTQETPPPSGGPEAPHAS